MTSQLESNSPSSPGDLDYWQGDSYSAVIPEGSPETFQKQRKRGGTPAPNSPSRANDPNDYSWHGDSYPSVKSEPEEIESEPEHLRKIKIRLPDIQEAYNKIKKDVIFTPLIEAKHVGKKFCNVFFKLENLQYTGSFKARGACNSLASLTHSERSKGVTISGGRNFLLAMTYYGHKMSIPTNVVVPKDCPIADRHRYRENYAVVKVFGSDQNDASMHALNFCEEIGTKYINGSDRLDLLTGYGTIGLELLNQMDRMDAIICPVGSGGLIASLIVAVKSIKPKVLIYGVECASCPVMTRALQEKKPVLVQMNATLADSLAYNIASLNAFNVIMGYLDRIVTVEEKMISRAMIMLMEREKLIVEGAAATPVAALLSGRAPELAGKNVVCLVTGGNVNSMRMSRVIDRGLAAEGRLVKFMATLPDIPGAMARLLVKVGETGADVRSMVPERTWMKRDIFSMSVNMVLETSDARHAREVEKRLMKEYPQSHFVML